jgi:hypothetical protein
LRITLLILALLPPSILFGQAAKSFVQSDYPANSFVIKKDRQTLGSISVEIVQVSPISNPEPNQFYCRAWLTVRRGNLVLEQRYFNDIEPVGSWFGLSFPDHQPIKELVLLSKFGDYDGRVYVVTRNGKMKDFPGGSFYISPDNRFIFSNHYSDLVGVTIFDLSENQLIYSGELENDVSDWYYDDGQYFALVHIDGNATDKRITFDLQTKQFKLDQLAGRVDERKKLKHYNNPKEKDCECGK